MDKELLEDIRFLAICCFGAYISYLGIMYVYDNSHNECLEWKESWARYEGGSVWGQWVETTEENADEWHKVCIKSEKVWNDNVTKRELGLK